MCLEICSEKKMVHTEEIVKCGHLNVIALKSGSLIDPVLCVWLLYIHVCMYVYKYINMFILLMKNILSGVISSLSSFVCISEEKTVKEKKIMIMDNIINTIIV